MTFPEINIQPLVRYQVWRDKVDALATFGTITLDFEVNSTDTPMKFIQANLGGLCHHPEI